MAGKHKTKLAGICKNCGSEFWARAWYIRTGKQQFCNRKCSTKGKFNGNFRGHTAATRRTNKATKKYPERHKCRRQLVKAVRQGKIEPRPCFVCGDRDAEGHHWDYAKPYDVFWLCRQHHVDVHKKLIELPLPCTPVMPAV